jgi:hypothetical protein
MLLLLASAAKNVRLDRSATYILQEIPEEVFWVQLSRQDEDCLGERCLTRITLRSLAHRPCLRVVCELVVTVMQMELPDSFTYFRILEGLASACHSRWVTNYTHRFVKEARTRYA